MPHEILTLSGECTTANLFERGVLANLQRAVGFDAGFFQTDGDFPTALGLEPAAVERLATRAGIYLEEVLPVKRAALAANGVAVDTEVLGIRHVSRTRYFREVASTVRGRHSLIACVPLRGRVVAGMMLGRSGSNFSPSELRRIEHLLPALGICRASYGLPAPAPKPLPSPAEGGLAGRLGIAYAHVRDCIQIESGRVTIVDRRGYREMVAARDGVEVVWSRASLDDSRRSGWPYIELLHLAAVSARYRRRALFVGCGGAVALRQFARTYPGISLDLVELEPKVVELARAWYDLDEIPNLTVHIGDGTRFVANTSSRWDIVVVDAYDASLLSTLAADRLLFQAIRRALSPGGAMTINVVASLDGQGELPRTLGMLRAVFDEVRVVPVMTADERYQPDSLRNVVVVAS